VRSGESVEEYGNLSKTLQDDLKDVGGYVGGGLRDGRRKVGHVLGRDLITLDMDSLPPNSTVDVLGRLQGLGCGYAVYSTRKHTPATPRLRVVLPLHRTLQADEYEPAARIAAHLIYPDMQPYDPSTFEAHRLMYWPSCCADAECVYYYEDKPLLDADRVLALLPNWHDPSQWPQVPGQAEKHQREVAQQKDPVTKGGLVGAFCRVYDIPAAMATFLPGAYLPAGDGRYTYAGGSSASGAVLYNDGRFLYSYHATDPCGRQLVNAFDFVRLHLFGEQDAEAKERTPANKMPSFVAMAHLAAADERVCAQLDADKQAQLQADFGGLIGQSPQPEKPDAAKPESEMPVRKYAVRRNEGGRYENTMANAHAILELDPVLQGKWRKNTFAERVEVSGAVPWDFAHTDTREWQDSDDAGIQEYMEQQYGLATQKNVMGALMLYANDHQYNPVTEYLSSLVWDGVPRLDRLLVDYLGAEDNEYTRAVTRKAFTACVLRAFEPGSFYDTMLCLISPKQGVGKSKLLRTLASGKWFCDSIYTMDGKDAQEQIQGVWIAEIAEMHAMRKADDTRVRQLVSQAVDRFRESYGRHAKDYPRRCVFFGTGNNRNFLRDKTGNRRFWPVDVDMQPRAKGRTVSEMLGILRGERDQIWAEAVARYRMGEKVWEDASLKALADAERDAHMEDDPQEGRIKEFLEKRIPKDWITWPLGSRRAFWQGSVTGAGELIARDRVCALEIWAELFEEQPGKMTKRDAATINAIIGNIEGWEATNGAIRVSGYSGKQRGFTRAVAETGAGNILGNIV
jgi:predicted P-loop ATPase